jgi:ubiquitin-conjugating enzyme E2 S
MISLRHLQNVCTTCLGTFGRIADVILFYQPLSSHSSRFCRISNVLFHLVLVYLGHLDYGISLTSLPPTLGRMLTKIFHPNVSSAGEICVNTLKKDWQPSFGIVHILTTVKCLLIYPNAESALDEEAGKMLLESYEDFCARARLITGVHARGRPVEFADAGSSTSAGGDVSKPAKTQSSTKPSAVPVIELATKSAISAVPTTRITSHSSHYGHGDDENEPSAGTLLPGKPLSKEGRHHSPAPLGSSAGNAGLGTSNGLGLDAALTNTTITNAPNAPHAPSTASGSAMLTDLGEPRELDRAEKPVVVIKPVTATKRTAPSAVSAEKRKKALRRL